MIRYIFAFIVSVHALIHFMGFAKAFHYAEIRNITNPISKITGLIWFLSALLLLAALIAYLGKYGNWWIIGAAGMVCSQAVILFSWKDAKYGTIANLIILLAVITGWGAQRFEKRFRQDVMTNLQRTNGLQQEMLTLADIQSLPLPVQHYLKYVGVIGKPKVNNMRVVFEGRMRGKGKNWFTFTSVQYNSFDLPSRLFFMKANMYGFTVSGYHRYADARAVMDIRLGGLMHVVYKAGEVMDKTETVTLFNDMCLLAPATLIDPRIRWEALDDSTARAIFTNQGIRVTATLHFNQKGQLTDFRSNDRTEVNEMKSYPFSTPVQHYANRNGFSLMSEGEAVWHYPDGPFTYGEFRLKELSYNVNTCTD